MLAGSFMHVEQPALHAGAGRYLCLVDHGGDAVEMENAGQGEATQTCADDRDGMLHIALHVLRSAPTEREIASPTCGQACAVGAAGRPRNGQRMREAQAMRASFFAT